jgi:hypothetical protein
MGAAKLLQGTAYVVVGLILLAAFWAAVLFLLWELGVLLHLH